MDSRHFVYQGPLSPYKTYKIIVYSRVDIKMNKTQAGIIIVMFVSSDLKIKLKHDEVSWALSIVPTVPNGEFCLDWSMKSKHTHTPLICLKLSSSFMRVSCFSPL